MVEAVGIEPVHSIPKKQTLNNDSSVYSYIFSLLPTPVLSRFLHLAAALCGQVWAHIGHTVYWTTPHTCRGLAESPPHREAFPTGIAFEKWPDGRMALLCLEE